MCHVCSRFSCGEPTRWCLEKYPHNDEVDRFQWKCVPSQRKDKGAGWVYILRHENSGYYKVGQSIHGGEHRARQLSTFGNEYTFVREFHSPSPVALEHVMHRHLLYRHVGNEIFAVSLDEVLEALEEECQRYLHLTKDIEASKLLAPAPVEFVDAGIPF